MKPNPASFRVIPGNRETQQLPVLKAPSRDTPVRGNQARVIHTKFADGIEVREQELGQVRAQQLYQLRCECNRSWFELQLPNFVECPACHKLCVVSL